MSSPRLEEINLNLLLALDVLLAEENVTRAAQRMGVTQSAMSRSLATLRTLFKDELLIRVGNEMQPTPYAAALKVGLRNNLADLQRLLRTAGVFDPSIEKGTIRIAAAGHLAALVGPHLVSTFENEAPGLDLRIEQLDGARLAGAIANGVDVALGPALDLGQVVDSRILFQDDFACLVRTDHPEVTGDSIDLDTYLGLNHIVISPTGRGDSIVDSELAPEHCRRVLVRVESFLLAPALVASTDLVLTAPRSSLMAAMLHHPVKIVPAPLALPSLRIAAYWDPRRKDDARMLWVLAALTSALSAYRAGLTV